MFREKIRPLVHLWRRISYKTAFANASGAATVIPIALTSLGRSGSSVTLGHLGCHPEISVFQLFSGEAHYINYFAQTIKTLSSPGSYLNPIRSGYTFGDEMLVGNAEVAAQFEPTADNLWFQQEYLPELRKFFSGKLAELYQWKKSSVHPGDAPSFVCEKFSPSGAVELVKEVFPEMKEVVLVRDFRDVLCSVLAFNRKRGFEAFGVEQFSDTEEYVRKCLAPSADILLERWHKAEGRAHLVRYEDFIMDRKQALVGMFAYIGTQSQDVRAVMETADRTQKDKQRKRHCTASDPIASIARYESELSPELIELCNETMEEPLREFGYL